MISTRKNSHDLIWQTRHWFQCSWHQYFLKGSSMTWIMIDESCSIEHLLSSSSKFLLCIVAGDSYDKFKCNRKYTKSNPIQKNNNSDKNLWNVSIWLWIFFPHRSNFNFNSAHEGAKTVVNLHVTRKNIRSAWLLLVNQQPVHIWDKHSKTNDK